MSSDSSQYKALLNDKPLDETIKSVESDPDPPIRASTAWYSPSTKVPESMDFDEVESVMWRKVNTTHHFLCLFSFILAPTSSIFPRSRPLVDICPSHHGMEVDSSYFDWCCCRSNWVLRSNCH